jgi:hypothetical protein
MPEPVPEPVDEYAASLAGAIEAAIPGWVRRSVRRVMLAWKGEVPAEVERAADEAAERARDEAGRRVGDLLARDIDEQRDTPLGILRSAVIYPTGVLQAAGVPPVERDEFRAHAFPGDIYDLAPASFADVDPALNDVALAWGAAKAMAHRRRHARP